MNVKGFSYLPSIFILCETCYWCATYLDKTRLPKDKCPECSDNILSSFPIMQDEYFTFNFTEKRGVELEFGKRSRKDTNTKQLSQL